MGWKGVKNHLSSRVIPTWSLSKKPSKNNLGHSVKEPLKQPSIRYYSGAVEGVTSPLDTKLEALFDGLRDAASDSKDKLELESTMQYLNDKLKISLENAELFVVMELLQTPSVGEITKKGYVDGWRRLGGVEPSHQLHAAHVRSLVASLSKDVTLFRKVYRYTFITGKESDQRALSLENALVYWNMLFSAPGMAWQSAGHDWLELWKTFLTEKWTRSVNKDMWNMTLEFALQTLARGDLGFWQEDGAWPSVIDDFVEWCRGKGIGQVETKSETMDVDQ